MKVVEIRRHSLTGEDKNLSDEGRELAQRAKASLLRERYDLVLSSPKARCLQTAEAFGFPEPKVDERFGTLPGEKLGPYDEQVRKLMEERGLSLLEAYFALPETRKVLEEKGREVVEAIIEVASSLPEGGSAFIVSHGGTIEPAALVALGGEFDLSVLGGGLEPCEGVAFLVEGEEIKGVSIIRLPKEVRTP